MTDKISQMLLHFKPTTCSTLLNKVNLSWDNSREVKKKKKIPATVQKFLTWEEKVEFDYINSGSAVVLWPMKGGGEKSQGVGVIFSSFG